MTFTFFLSRLLTAAIVILGVSCLVFLLIHLVPGDPIDVMLGESAQPADKEALRHALGLHLPLHVQWVHYLGNVFSFDLGTSIFSGQPIRDLLLNRVPATLELGMAAMCIAILMALPLGVVAAVRRNTLIDFGSVSFAVLGAAIPNFCLGPLLILGGAIYLGWFPVGGREGLLSLCLPSITLGVGMAAIVSRMVRSSILEVLSEDFIRTARAKGLDEKRIIIRHAMSNAWLPVLTLLSLQLGAVLSGAVITETIFSWPGIGSLLVESIQRRDYPVVQATVLLICLFYVAVNFLTDMLYAWVDPRIRLESET